MKSSYFIIISLLVVTISSCKKFDYSTHDNKGKTLLTYGAFFDTLSMTDSTLEFSVNFIDINDLNPIEKFVPAQIKVVPRENEHLFSIKFIDSDFITINENLPYFNVFHFHNYDNTALYDEKIGFFLEQYLANDGVKNNLNSTRFAFFDLDKKATEITPVNMQKFYEFNFSDGNASINNVHVNEYLKGLNKTIDYIINEAPANASKNITLFNYSLMIDDLPDTMIINMVRNKIADHNIRLNFVGNKPDYRINHLIQKSGGFESIAKRFKEKDEDGTPTGELVYGNDLSLKSSQVTLQNLHQILTGNVSYHRLNFKITITDPYLTFPLDLNQFKGATLDYNGHDFKIHKPK